MIGVAACAMALLSSGALLLALRQRLRPVRQALGQPHLFK